MSPEKQNDEKILDLIETVEDEFNRFINFALSEKKVRKNVYYEVDGERFKTLFRHWKNCTKKLNTSLDDYFLNPEKINKSQTKKNSDVSAVKGAVQKSPPRINKLLKAYYSSENKSPYKLPNKKIKIEEFEPKNTGGLYRFTVTIEGEDSIDFISKFHNRDKFSSTGIPETQQPYSDYDDMAAQLSDAERLLKDKGAIPKAIRKYQQLISASNKFHTDIITSIVHQIRIRAEYKGKISSVYPEIQDIDQPVHEMRKVVEFLFKLLAKNYKKLNFANLYFGRLDLRRIHFSTKSSNPYENSLRYANFNGCNIGWTAFNGMDLTGANFANINCARAAMFNEKTILKNVNFYNANLIHMNRDPDSGSIITENYDPRIFLNVKTMYCAYLDKDLEDYLRKKKLSLFDPL